MIILRADDESAVVAALDKLFQGNDNVSILQSEDEITMEELVASVAFNAKQQRIYVGRLERNTRKMDDSLRAIEKFLEPVATYFTYLLAESGADEEGAEALRRQREQSILKDSVLSKKSDGTR